ncbi:MAG TPA: type II secretion system F family protein [Methanoregulaceae archaeon]|nr:type II secretion system F family protein [Methanolinea sp.]MCC7567068.1 type II secretion system F family protein [Methanoregulaceae archaeon]MDD3090231.1 type II secretion system F family protein [Methanoregulaceae archaeon]MDD5047292.1 type II secretion system F family protein [Methanoregulaceae archaeon]MDD5685489.1 type II secretion system F family protein [Methanoregulaceae archaeon]
MRFNTLIRNYIRRDPLRHQQVYSDLISSRMGMTLAHYLETAIKISIIAGLLLALFSFWISGFIIYGPSTQGYTGLYNIFNVPVPEPGMVTRHMLGFQIAVGLVAFLLGSVVVFYLILKFPSLQKGNRRTKINLTLHNAVAYMYAMRKGGAQLMPIFRSLSDNAKVYGEIALEFRQVVRDCDFFGYDVVTAIRHLMTTTPSEKLKEFLEDMISVIESGGDLTTFLAGRVKLYQDEARFEQKQYLSFLSLVAESYVTLFVAGPLFLIIIMVVMGMMGGVALLQLSAVVYALIPIGSAIFIILIDIISIKTETVERYVRARWLHEYSDVRIVKKPGEEKFFAKLVQYDRFRNLREFLRHPIRAFIRNYSLTLYFTIPLAVLYLIALFLQVPSYTNTEIYIDVVDDHIMIALLIVLVPYAVFYELWRRNILGMESLIPDFLERMAGINQVGLTIAQAIGIMVNTNLGLLSYEIRRIKRDIDWGGSFSDALMRFENRVRTPLIARTVTLITKASQMSGSIGDVLSISASDAKMSDILKRERLSDMFIYTAIIYLAFFVFLFVVGVITNQFMPILSEINTEGIPTGTALSGFSAVSLYATERLMYHGVVAQAVFSGLIAGQMGEGSVRAGIKHACIMLVITLFVFNLFV